MQAIRFEWDETKNLANQRKHGISFEDAVEVFDDPLLVSIQDRMVDGEERWQTFGCVRSTILTMVAHTWRDQNEVDVVRVISARPATRQERKKYEAENS